MKHWQNSADDIELFSKKGVQLFDDFAKSLLAALPTDADSLAEDAYEEEEQSDYAEGEDDDGSENGAVGAESSADVTMQDSTTAPIFNPVGFNMTDEAFFASHAAWVKSTIRAMNIKLQEIASIPPDQRDHEETKRYIKEMIGFQENEEKDPRMKEELKEYDPFADEKSD